jgi:hypothetical protein
MKEGAFAAAVGMAEEGRSSPHEAVCKQTEKDRDGTRTRDSNEGSRSERCMSKPTGALRAQTRRELVAQMAPAYREASLARKGILLDRLVEMTGYARKYAIGLLNQEAPGLPPLRHPRQPRYGSEVQQALCVAWRATRSICAKRLIPFLPDFLPYLERKGRIQLNAEQRKQLLSMRSATAERFLRTQQIPQSGMRKHCANGEKKPHGCWRLRTLKQNASGSRMWSNLRRSAPRSYKRRISLHTI